MKNRDESTDSSQPTDSDDDAPRDPAVAGPSFFQCEFPGCIRTFTTANGRGVHHRRTHAAWYDSRALELNKNVKKRWNDEELRVLALREVSLTRFGA